MEVNFDSNMNVWSGLKSPFSHNPDASIGEIFEKVAKEHHSDLAQIFEPTGGEMTHGDIHRSSMKVAHFLSNMNLNQNDVVGICASNTPHLASVVFGAFLNSTPVSTLDPSFDKDGMKHMFGITKPKVMFCDESVLENLKAAISELNLDCLIYSVDGEGEQSVVRIVEEATEDYFSPIPLKNGGDQTAAIVCSSGSTGYPKGVTISHKAIIYGAFISIFQPDRILCFSSLYWLSGLFTLTCSTLKASTRVITNKPFTPELTLLIIDKYKVTTMFTPPSQMALMVQHPDLRIANTSTLKNYYCGGSAVPYTIVQKMRDLIPNCKISVGYGMTEIGGACVIGSPSAPGSIPSIKNNFQIRIVDDEGKNLGPNNTGEIVIKPPYNWEGYFGDKKATDEIFKDGWIFSGDLGYFDEQGVLYIVDRKKDILKYMNFHYFPTEIENVIMELPDVIEVCVSGVPDLVMTDLPAAAVIKRQGSLLTDVEVSEYVKKRLVDFKQLRGGVYFLDNLPKTASGKNLRSKVKDIVEKMYNEKKAL